MHHMRFLAAAVAIVLGARGGFGTTHGEISDFNDESFRWQELADGFFTGIPPEEWNDKIHKRSNMEWDIDEILATGNISMPSASDGALLESRDLQTQCKAVRNCVRDGGVYVLITAYQGWVSAANYARESGPKLWEFLNKPFIANAGGVAVAGVISGQINKALDGECSAKSTGDSQAEVLRAAIAAVVDTNPKAGEISVEVEGPSGKINIKLKAGAPGSTPNPTCG